MSDLCALLVIDVQNDFCEGGALEVSGGSEIVEPINALMEAYDVVILSQDWIQRTINLSRVTIAINMLTK